MVPNPVPGPEWSSVAGDFTEMTGEMELPWGVGSHLGGKMPGAGSSQRIWSMFGGRCSVPWWTMAFQVTWHERECVTENVTVKTLEGGLCDRSTVVGVEQRLDPGEEAGAERTACHHPGDGGAVR